jgi:hypothetical protein
MATFVFILFYATQFPRVKFQTYQPWTLNPAAMINAAAAIPIARTNIGGVRI